MLCGICMRPTNSSQIGKLFADVTCANLRSVLNRFIRNTIVCFECYIRVGTISYLLHAYSTRKAHYTHRSKPGRSVFCSTCKTPHKIEVHSLYQKEYLSYILNKLNGLRVKDDFYPLCKDCDEIIVKINNILVIYHGARLLPMGEVDENETDNEIDVDNVSDIDIENEN